VILSDGEIRVFKDKLVDPFIDDNVQPASIDLTLDREFIVFQPHMVRAIDLRNPDSFASLGKKVVIEDGGEFIIHPREFVLAATEERVTLPDNIAGRLEGKSSLARVGLIIHATGGFIDPGFRGPITLEMSNWMPAPIILRPGDLICQVSFQFLMTAAKNPYKGRYQNANGVEASKYGLKNIDGRYASEDSELDIPAANSGWSGAPELSSNHPAIGNLSKEELDESGYDGPMVK